MEPGSREDFETRLVRTSQPVRNATLEDDMPVFKLHSTSFTIEGARGETFSSIAQQAGRILFEWAQRKEKRFHFKDSEIPPGFPSLEHFINRSSWNCDEFPSSAFASAVGKLPDGRDAWFFFYKHEAQQYDGDFLVEVVFVSLGFNAAVCSVSLSFEGSQDVREYPGYQVMPPGFISDLWRLGNRTYNSRCCSTACFRVVQSGLSHVRQNSPLRFVSGEDLNVFLEDDERKMFAVVIPDWCFSRADQTMQKTIQIIAAQLIGRAEVFLEHRAAESAVFVYDLGSSRRIQMPFRINQLKKLKDDLLERCQNLGYPPLEEDAIASMDDLANFLSSEPSEDSTPVAVSNSSTEEAQPGVPRNESPTAEQANFEPPDATTEMGRAILAENEVDESSFLAAAMRAKDALRQLVANLDSWTQNEGPLS